jgi:biopolymer transport protein ExbB
MKLRSLSKPYALLLAAAVVLTPGLTLAETPAAGAPAAAPTVSSLDQLLNQVRTMDVRDAQDNAAREARFKANTDEQGAMLKQAEAEKAALNAESAALVRTFEENDKQIAQLQQSRDAKAGNLGEMFGVLRQAAGDFASEARNSALTLEFPDRIALIDRLAQTKSMPPMEDLQRFWFEQQREMTEGGKIKEINAPVVGLDGVRTTQKVTLVGPFVVFSDGKFMQYATGADAYSLPVKQPPSSFRSVAKKFASAEPGYHSMVIDPTRGVILSLYSQRPTIIDRIHMGGWVGYLIIFVGVIGMILAIYQFVYLNKVTSKVNAQLGDLNRMSDDNPLGRVMLAFKGKTMPEGEEAEVVELRISEAVMRELPPIQRIQPFLKLAVAAGPLMGLVGTVIGMIETFQVITESGSGDPKLMAAGISTAMIATVLGLSIAIPLLFINSALQSRSKRIVQILDEQSTGLLAEIMERKTHA